ncbi:MAG TPA: c-type cytochrome [Rhodanobacteraceae bacterium]
MPMTRLRSRSLLRAFAAASLFALASTLAGAHDFVDLRSIPPLHGDASAGKEKAAVCSACHGAAGISPAAAFPNLAGQHAEYLYWQLVEFQREARPESPMTSQVKDLDDATLRNLAAWFALQPPAPFNANATPATDRGARLFREGDPATGTPPCQGCHGADAGGFPLAADNSSYRTYPILRGQHADYVVQRLRDFRDGKHASSTSDRIMTPVAKTLDDEAIHAVALFIEAGR